MNKKRAFTMTVIFKALSPNYGESVGNVSELKKLSHGGKSYSFVSRQALRHEFWKFLNSNYKIDTPEYWKSTKIGNDFLNAYKKKQIIDILFSYKSSHRICKQQKRRKEKSRKPHQDPKRAKTFRFPKRSRARYSRY